MTRKTLFEKMKDSNVPKSWLTELRAIENGRDKAEARAQEYGLIIDRLAPENAELNKRVAEYESLVSDHAFEKGS